MVDVEIKRDRIVIRAGGKKWDWMIEPRYWRNTLYWTIGLLLFPLIAYFLSPGLINTMVAANIYAAIAIPLSLMTVGTGRINFGPNFYVGIGGYTAALLSIHLGWGPIATLPFAIILSLFAAVIFSPLVIMARGLYYVLLTLLLPLVFLEVTFIYTGIFKGDVGLFGIELLVQFENAKLNFLSAAYISAGIMLLYLLITNKVLKSRYGLIMATVNDDEDVAHGLGVNIAKTKIITFVCASGMIGIVGWFLAHYFGTFAGITYLPMTYMLKILLVFMVGGRAQVFGCVVGGYFVAFLEMILIRTMGQFQPVAFPIILLILLFALPRGEGLFGLYRRRHYREYMPTIHVRR
ncbi:MAG: branched-chain amino acid ABC transporter permease [Syntrophales bacterium]|jgi:branched-chain amino acid transport system permease protein|nr:branched-chain amino acid ABC transporter permease [Syntrophales bacterium]MDY0045302.1 branched-chain amino acid ABC transporter permease [Syntrophales bacterium]